MSAKGPLSWAIEAGTLVVWPVTVPRACFTALLDGLAGARIAYPHGRPKDVIIIPSLMPVADDVHVDDIREGVASLGEPMDVIP